MNGKLTMLRSCHPEHSEGSLILKIKILRYAQDDNM